MSKHSRRTITIVITDTWTIRWGDDRATVDATATAQPNNTTERRHLMNHTSKTDTFWQTYLATLPPDGKAHTQPYTVWDFADTPEAATKVGNLVRLGVKTTTSSLMWGLEEIGEPLPQVGELAVVVDGTGEPLCVIEVTEVEIKPFNTVDEQFAFEYGEGDRTLADWQRDNWDYLARWCAEIGRVPSETMLLGCQRFRLLYPKASIPHE